MKSLIFAILFLLIISVSYAADGSPTKVDVLCKQRFNELTEFTNIDYKTNSVLNERNSKVMSIDDFADELMDFSFGSECQDTQWGIRASLLLGQMLFDSNELTIAESFFRLALMKIDGIKTDEDYFKSVDFWIFPEFDQSLNYLRQEAINGMLISFFRNGDCKAFLTLQEYYGEYIELMDAERVLSFEKMQFECRDLVSDIDENTIYGKSYMEIIKTSAWYQDLVEDDTDKIIDVYLLNDYGFTSEEFDDKVGVFKQAILDELPNYEFLGDINDKKLKDSGLAITTMFMEFDEPQCWASTDGEIDDLCECNTSDFLWDAVTKGADALVIITPVKCRSWAYMGGYSVVSWPRTPGSGGTTERYYKGKLTTFEYLDEYVLIHELGHLLWGLYDEYDEKGADLVAGFPNCASNEFQAAEWWGDIIGSHTGYSYENFGEVGIFEGCGYSKEPVRPTAMSIMKTHFFFSKKPHEPAIFGPVNDRHMRNVMEIYGE